MIKNVFSYCGIFLILFTTHSSLQADFSTDFLFLERTGTDNSLSWIENSKAAFKEQSEVVQTAKGPIEYFMQGDGPVVLCLHGGCGGYDQSYLIGEHLIKKGFTVLAVSRPGYLRTPLVKGKNDSAALQADAMVALLDKLGIKRVAALGFSAGGPVAFQLALRHPNRTWGLVLECIGSQPQDAAIYSVMKEFLEKNDLGLGLEYISDRKVAKSTANWFLPLDVDDTLSKKAHKARVKHLVHHKDQLRFLQKLLYSCVPVSSRRAGIINDLDSVDPWPGYNFSRLRTQTLIIQSLHDGNGAYDDAKKLVHANIKDSKLVTVEDSGHFIWLGKNSNKWQKKLVKFLKKNDPTKNGEKFLDELPAESVILDASEE
jgi:pimeloyl-ACP methyl ester carboxylesterase